MALQWAVPADVLTASKGSVGAMVGLITLLLALVLGFLVFTAFSVYATQQTEAQSLGPVIIELDVLLEEYGPDIVSVRKGLRELPRKGSQALLRRCQTGGAGAHARGDARDHALDEHLFRHPPAAERAPPAIARLGARSRQEVLRNEYADGAPARRSVSALRDGRGRLLGRGPVSRQRPGRAAECGHDPGSSRGLDRHRQRDFSDPRTEHALYGAHPPVAGQP